MVGEVGTDQKASWQGRTAERVRVRLWLASILPVAVALAGSCGDVAHDTGSVQEEGDETDAGSARDAGNESDTVLIPEPGNESDAGVVQDEAGGSDTGSIPDGGDESQETSVAPDGDAAPDSASTTDAALPNECTAQGTLDPVMIPVHGTIQGPRVDALLCENGVGTSLIGPEGAAGSPYAQRFGSDRDGGGPGVDAILVRTPSDTVSTSLSGWAGATAPEVGTYTSTEESCGWLRFEVSFPVPPDVTCPPPGQSCTPDCEPDGTELPACVPAHPTWRYVARPAAQCEGVSDVAAGEWQLTVTSVAPFESEYTLLNFLTHGRLTATLVNEEDPSDTVALDLDF